MKSINYNTIDAANLLEANKRNTYTFFFILMGLVRFCAALVIGVTLAVAVVGVERTWDLVQSVLPKEKK
jgi:hypothetical protein